MKDKLWLGLVSALNLGTYFVFQFFIIKSLGPGGETDAFIASNTVPQFVVAVIGGSIGYVLVPVLSTRPVADLRHDTWSFVYVIGALFCGLAVLLFALRRLWIPVMVPGFTDSQLVLMEQLVAIQLLSMPISAVIAVQVAGQAAQGRFVRAELTQWLANLVAIGLLIIFMPSHGVLAGAWISLVRWAIQASGLCFGLGPPRRARRLWVLVKTPLARIKPLLLGSSYYRTEPAVDRYLLSNANSGALTLYYLVEQVFSGISQLIIRTLVAPTVPRLSVLFDRHDFPSFSRLYALTVKLVFLVSALLLGALVCAAAYLLPALATRFGAPIGTWADLWWIMLLLGGVFIGSASGQVASSGFYATGDTVTPTRMSMITYSIFIPCKVLAFQMWGIPGLAISASLYSMNNFLLQVVLMRRKLRLRISAGTSLP